jgi:hypothetical protein
MTESSDTRLTRMPLNNGSGHMPALGFGALIPGAAETSTASRDALEAGFRYIDCAARYRNDREVNEALQTRVCLPRPRLHPTRGRISISLFYRKMRLTKSVAFRLDNGLNPVVKTGIPGCIAQRRQT